MTEEVMEGQVGMFDRDIWSGKTSLEPSQAITAKTSEPSSPRSRKSKSQKRQKFLCLMAVGPTADASTMSWVDGPLLGEFTMHSFGECPNEENASRLSQILEDCPHPKYSLSVKACEGILRRAEKRGKELPTILKDALIQQASMDGMSNQSTSNLKMDSQRLYIAENAEAEAERAMSCKTAQSVSKNEPESQGGGKGILIQNEHVGALSTLNNQAVLAVDGYNGAISQTQPSLGVNCGISTGRNGVMALENHPADSRVKINEDNVVQTLSSRMGTGGGNVPMVMEYDTQTEAENTDGKKIL